MQYLLLVYTDEANQQTGQEKGTHGESMEEAVRAAHQAGVLVSVARLEPTIRARTGRISRDQVAFTDGPFAETKEQLAGFCLLDCRDEAEAREWAARFIRTGCPNAMEVRPIAWVPDLTREIMEPEPVAV
jgi:hypothetical protein